MSDTFALEELVTVKAGNSLNYSTKTVFKHMGSFSSAYGWARCQFVSGPVPYGTDPKLDYAMPYYDMVKVDQYQGDDWI